MQKILLSVLALACILLVEAQPVAGLMAYWPMNGNFADNGPNNITVTNNGSTSTTNTLGVAGYAMNFLNPGPGVVQFANQAINSNVNFSGSQNFSIDFSVYANTPYVSAGGFYDNNLNYGAPGVWFWNNPGYPQLRFNYKNASIGSTNGAFPLGEWKHVCFVRDAGTLSIYINGVLNVSGPEGTTSPSYPNPAKFGTMYFNSPGYYEYNGFNGKLDDFRIYNRALTATEIQELSDIVVPVKLSSFTAINRNNIVSLNWQTQYEQNSSYFKVQRSNDAVNFEDITRVGAAGNTNTIKHYFHQDVLPVTIQAQKIVYYRLQSVDTDGKFSYSQTIALLLNKNELQLLVFPNPAKNLLQVQMSADKTCNASLIITDARGTSIYQKEIKLQQGANSIPVNISLLSSGTYQVQLADGKEVYVKQFVKE